MTLVYFIRHGQAGSRQAYDQLSNTGKDQARRLGEWFARRGIQFDEAVSGRLARQHQTAEAVRSAYTGFGLPFPEVNRGAAWDEFDLDAVYAGIAPQLARRDVEFERQYNDLQRQSQDASSPVHRSWSACDVTLVRAWIDGEYSFDGESFTGFTERVRAAGLTDTQPNRNIAVFTSATPASVWAAGALGVDGRKIMELAAAMYNTGVTVLRLDGSRVRLLQFNSVAHLDDPGLLTTR